MKVRGTGGEHDGWFGTSQEIFDLFSQWFPRLVIPKREIRLHDVARPIPLWLRVPSREHAQYPVGRVPPAGDAFHGRQAEFVSPVVEERADNRIEKEPLADAEQKSFEPTGAKDAGKRRRLLVAPEDGGLTVEGDDRQAKFVLCD